MLVSRVSLLLAAAGFVGCVSAPEQPARNDAPEPYIQDETRAGQLTVEPARITFPNTLLGHAESHWLTLLNDAWGELNVLEVELRDRGADFALAWAAGVAAPRALEPGDALRLQVVYRPTTPGKHTAIVRIHTDDPEWPLVDVEITGNTTDECLEVTPRQLLFADTALGDRSEADVVLHNCGTVDVTVSGAGWMPGSSPAFEVGDDGFEPTLAPGSAGTLNVRFSPTDSGHQLGVLELKTDLTGKSTVGVVVSGRAVRLPFIAPTPAYRVPN